MSAVTIAPADAEALYEMDNGETEGEWTRVTEQQIGSRRWQTDHYLVVSKGDDFFGVPFSLGLTENQEHDFPWRAGMWANEEPGPIKLVPLIPVQVTTTTYQKAKAATGG